MGQASCRGLISSRNSYEEQRSGRRVSKDFLVLVIHFRRPWLISTLLSYNVDRCRALFGIWMISGWEVDEAEGRPSLVSAGEMIMESANQAIGPPHSLETPF